MEKGQLKTIAAVIGGLGVFIYIIGRLFAIMHWPFGKAIQMLGWVLVIAAIIIIFISLILKK